MCSIIILYMKCFFNLFCLYILLLLFYIKLILYNIMEHVCFYIFIFVAYLLFLEEHYNLK